MSHDALCPHGNDEPGGCRCSFIALVRADEGSRWLRQLTDAAQTLNAGLQKAIARELSGETQP